MSRVDVVRAAMVEAMKAKDKARKDSLSMLLSALKNAEIDKRSPLTEEEADAVVKKEIKQTKETLELAPADRADIREEAQARLAVYQEFAPEDLTEGMGRLLTFGKRETELLWDAFRTSHPQLAVHRMIAITCMDPVKDMTEFLAPDQMNKSVLTIDQLDDLIEI